MTANINAAPRIPCECEDARHFPEDGGTGHGYGNKFPAGELQPVSTPWGTFYACEDCRRSCGAFQDTAPQQEPAPQRDPDPPPWAPDLDLEEEALTIQTGDLATMSCTTHGIRPEFFRESDELPASFHSCRFCNSSWARHSESGECPPED